MMKVVKIKKFELGLLFSEGTFERVLPAGTHVFSNFRNQYEIDIVSRKELQLQHEQLDEIFESAELVDLAELVEVKNQQRGFVWLNGRFEQLLGPGKYIFWDLFNDVQVDIVYERNPLLVHDHLDLLVRENVLEGLAHVVDLKDNQRGLVWVDGRFYQILQPGLYAYWTTQQDVKVEVVETDSVRFEHPALQSMLKVGSSNSALSIEEVEQGQQGVLYVEGKLAETLPAGRYAFWKNSAPYRVYSVEMRETTLDIAGQEIMTADKVTLRMNAAVTYQVVEPVRFVSATDNVIQSLYREAQLALRAVVGSRLLDDFLNDKNVVAEELESLVRKRSGDWGLEIVSAGIRDVILPGDMKELMNKVTEAKKAAEANLISRREETAAMRSQANTAKILENNPTLMRLRELEVLERISRDSKLNVLLGEKGLADKMVNLL